MGAIPVDTKEEEIGTWLPGAIDDPKEWEIHRKLCMSNFIGHKNQVKEQMRVYDVASGLG
eukprot:7958981-Ditylum_brightwellii.AAC.1